jgi:sec-independent protein translocase protein TatA
MFGSLGMPELLLILVIALIVFGPKKLPEVGRSLGKAMREFKRTTEEIKGKFEEQINAEEFKDLKSGLEGIKAEIKSATELPAEIKDLGIDLNAPLTEPTPPAAEPPAPASEPAPAAPAPDAPPSSDPAPHPTPARTEMGVPARPETGATGTASAATGAGETPDAVPTADPASPHGKG